MMRWSEMQGSWMEVGRWMVDGLMCDRQIGVGGLMARGLLGSWMMLGVMILCEGDGVRCDDSM